MDREIEAAAELIGDAEALLITAGAGMGVDSGLPDSRGDEGFWNAQEIAIEVDETTMRAVCDLPRCPDCNRIARPTILMFGDGGYLDERNAEQYQRLDRWLKETAEANSFREP